jgi:ribose/xylose/arabinose/galactoside ABC-type transport system permease subunit
MAVSKGRGLVSCSFSMQFVRASAKPAAACAVQGRDQVVQLACRHRRCESTPSGETSAALSRFWAWQLAQVYVVTLLTAAVWGLVWLALNRTVWGRHVYAIGGDDAVARRSGVRTTWVRFAVYVGAALLAAVAGIVTASRAGVGDPNAGAGLEFESLAAVVIGGASLAGGRGRIVGILGGVMLLSIIGNLFNLLGVSVWYQQLLKGAIILLGAAAYVGRRELAGA